MYLESRINQNTRTNVYVDKVLNSFEIHSENAFSYSNQALYIYIYIYILGPLPSEGFFALRFSGRNSLQAFLNMTVNQSRPSMLIRTAVSRHFGKAARQCAVVISLVHFKFFIITNLTHFFMNLFISSLYMFRASQCSSLRDRIVYIYIYIYIYMKGHRYTCIQ